MIAPASGDLEITRRKSLQAEPQGPNQFDRLFIPRLDIRFDTMKGKVPEHLYQETLQRFAHITATTVRRKSIVTEKPRLERPTNDLVQIHDTEKFVRFQ